MIAIVDDDPKLLKAMVRLLSTHALAAKPFQSGPHFLASLSEGLPDCLILDLQMPEMSGLDLQDDLTRRGIKIPTIIVTSNREPAMRERCMSAGAIAYLSKPVRQEALLAAIDAARMDTHGR